MRGGAQIDDRWNRQVGYRWATGGVQVGELWDTGILQRTVSVR